LAKENKGVFVNIQGNSIYFFIKLPNKTESALEGSENRKKPV
jgi:hypothetical protein